MAARSSRRVPTNRTGVPVRPGHAMRRVRLECGHVQRDRLAHSGDRVWCDSGCGDFRRVVAVEE
jgi:hypothetical protein